MEKRDSLSKVEDANFEHIFWLQVLGDHLRIFLGTLDAKEVETLKEANRLKENTDSFLKLARKGQVDTDVVFEVVHKIREFKLVLLARRMNNSVKLNLPPFFINHMLNELEEYQKILDEDPSDILKQHKLWLNDAAGHVGSLIADLDITEGIRKKKLKKLMKNLECLNKSALETIGFRRTEEIPSGWYDELSEQAYDHIEKFVEQLEEMQNIQENDALMSRIPKLVLDHMQREEAYYLSKILEFREAPLDKVNIQRQKAIAERIE